MAVRMQHCCWCGEELGVYDDFGELVSCGKSECNREMSNMIRDARDNRYLDAADDDFSRY